MCSASAPAAPDYAGAAKQQGQSDIQTAIANAVMNRPNENTPLGSRSWEQSGTYTVPGVGGLPAVNVPQYTSNINLTPQGQQLYQSGLNMQQGLMNQAGSSINQPLDMSRLQQAQSATSQPMDASNVKQLTDQAYSTITSRLDPQWNAAKTSEETKLINQGLTPGGEAYNNDMRVFNQAKNDAYQQGGLAALSYAPQLLSQEQAIRMQPYNESQQSLQQQIAARIQPFNEMQALQSGGQVSMPQFGGTQPTNIQGANYQTALGQQAQYQQGVYNADAQNAASMNTGLATMGGAVIAGIF